MTTRWFFSHAQQGVATGITAGSQVHSLVTFERELNGGKQTVDAQGPDLKLAGPAAAAPEAWRATDFPYPLQPTMSRRLLRTGERLEDQSRSDPRR